MLPVTSPRSVRVFRLSPSRATGFVTTIRRTWECLAIEVGELLEHFQWLTDDQAGEVKRQPERMADVRGELADVLIYLMYLAAALDVDLLAAVREKMDINERRFAPKALE